MRFGGGRRVAERPQLVPNVFQCCDRALLHRGVDGVVRELSLSEERRQAADRIRSQLEVVEDAGEVLVRGLRWGARDSVRGEHALEVRVRGDDRPPRIGFRAEVVEGVVESRGELFGKLGLRVARPPSAAR